MDGGTDSGMDRDGWMDAVKTDDCSRAPQETQVTSVQ